MAKKLNEIIKLALLIADCPIHSFEKFKMFELVLLIADCSMDSIWDKSKSKSENLVQAQATLHATETLVETVSHPEKLNLTKQFNSSGKKQSQNKIAKSTSRPKEYKANYRDWDEYRWKKPNNTFRSQVVGSLRQQKSGDSSFKHSWQQAKNPQLGAREPGSLRQETVFQVPELSAESDGSKWDKTDGLLSCRCAYCSSGSPTKEEKKDFGKSERATEGAGVVANEKMQPGAFIKGKDEAKLLGKTKSRVETSTQMSARKHQHTNISMQTSPDVQTLPKNSGKYQHQTKTSQTTSAQPSPAQQPRSAQASPAQQPSPAQPSPAQPSPAAQQQKRDEYLCWQLNYYNNVGEMDPALAAGEGAEDGGQGNQERSERQNSEGFMPCFIMCFIIMCIIMPRFTVPPPLTPPLTMAQMRERSLRQVT